MKRAKWIKIFDAFFLFTILFGGSACAGGISLYEFGSPDVGLAVPRMTGGSLFVVQKINKDFSIGFGVLSYFRLRIDYDNGPSVISST